MTIEFSEDQLAALDAIESWRRIGKPMLTLGGYAGTGKSTLIAETCRRVGGQVAVCAPTGKAADNLRKKGLPATTVHRLIYTPQRKCRACRREIELCECKESIVEVEWQRVSAVDCKLIIVDEASMVNTRMMEDLLAFHIPILFVGDHGQLEPVGENPGLMKNPEIRLEKIHRQAGESPIIRFAHHLRMGEPALTFVSTDGVLDIQSDFYGNPLEYDIILCAFNERRVAVNDMIREQRSFDGAFPKIGERVICLQNNKNFGVFNGMLGTVRESYEEWGQITVVDDIGEIYPRLPVVVDQFRKEKAPRDYTKHRTFWDFGYCLTVHKAQGSEWDSVLVSEQASGLWSMACWRYTAATRAAKRLTWCVG